MKRVIAAIAVLAACYGRAAYAAPEVVGCLGQVVAAHMEPLEVGPAKLVKVACVSVARTSFSRPEPQVSPDGRRYFDKQSHVGLRLGDIDGGGEAKEFEFDPFTPLDFSPPFTWASDSGSVWGAAQDVTLPGHFATGPLRPARIWPDGRQTQLAPLTHPVGDLDALHWVGGNGLAIAEFGALGRYYKPERPNANPTLAIVDARRGAVRQSVSFAALGKTLALSTPLEGLGVRILDGRAVQGKVSALLGVRSDWVLWREGSAPYRLALPYKSRFAQGALTPDGRRVLVSLQLQAEGAICEYTTRCPRPTPKTGVAAALHDVATGKAIWALTVTATQFENPPSLPAISPDGRFALVTMPPLADAPNHVALIDMRDGRVLQRFKQVATDVFGFTADGRAWITSGGVIAFYELRG